MEAEVFGTIIAEEAGVDPDRHRPRRPAPGGDPRQPHPPKHAGKRGAVQEATGETVTLADVDQADTGDTPKQAAADHGIAVAVITRPEVNRGVVVLPRRWVVERDVGWMRRFRRLARDQERLADVVKGFQLLACTMRMGKQVLPMLSVL